MKQSAIEAVSASASADQVYRLQPQPPGEVVSLMLRHFPMIVVKTNRPAPMRQTPMITAGAMGAYVVLLGGGLSRTRRRSRFDLRINP